MADIVCIKASECGMADECPHGKPHPGWRCSCCGTACWHSNGLCNGGRCSEPDVPREKWGALLPLYCAPVQDNPQPRSG